MLKNLLEVIKNLFMSKKKKLILDIKKKHNKNITDMDICDYRRKHRMYPDTKSDNDILVLILLEDEQHTRCTESAEVKYEHPISSNYSDFYTNRNNTSHHSSPHTTPCEYNYSYKSPKSSRNVDYNESDSHDHGRYSSSSDSGSPSSSCN